MIDLVHNVTLGLCVVHDDESLSGAVALRVRMDGRCGLETSDGCVVAMERSLPENFVLLLRTVTECTVVRVLGARAIEEHGLRVVAE